MKDTTRTLVYIDGTALVRTPYTGIGHYTRELIRGLARDESIEPIILLFSSDAALSHLLPEGVAAEYIPMPRKIAAGISKFLKPINFHFFLHHRNPAWVIYPNFSLFPYVSSRNTRTISVVHDLAYVHYPETIESKNLAFLQKALPFTVEQSTFIACPSEFTRDDLLEHFPAAQRHHTLVAQPGYTKTPYEIEDIRPEVQHAAQRKYLLFISTIEPRKNVERLVSAVRSLQADSSFQYDLVIAGKQGWGGIEIKADAHFHTLGVISNEERSYLLDHCDAFVFPSLFEGFGMPLLEAIAHSKPIVSTTVSSLGEIADHHTAYVIDDPLSVDSISEQIKLFSEDAKHHPERIAKKISQYGTIVTTYTWENTSRQFLKIIKENS